LTALLEKSDQSDHCICNYYIYLSIYLSI